ncbi:MAG: preprotein translocase subunit SecG [Caulobacteraceae bacterium]
MLVGLLLTLNILICIALTLVVLLQPSEGEAFGASSPTALMTPRGKGNLLTRVTWVLFALFLIISLVLTLLAAHGRSSQSFLSRLKNTSINPDALSKTIQQQQQQQQQPAAPQTPASNSAPAATPTPPPPPVKAAARSARRVAPRPARPPAQTFGAPTPTISVPAPAPSTASPSLALPPLGSTSNAPSPPAQGPPAQSAPASSAPSGH